MYMEMDDQAGELTPEQQAQEDADFEAAFNQVAGTTPTTESATESKDADPAVDAEEVGQDDEAKAAAEAAAAAQAQADADAAAAQAQADAANAPVTITQADLDAIRAQLARVPDLEAELRRVHDTTAGRIGSLKQSIDALKDKAGSGNKMAIKQMKRLSEEYPELAQMLMEDLNDASGDGGTTAQPEAQAQGDEQASGDNPGADAAAEPAVQVDPLEHPEVQKRLRAAEMAIVSAVHPDWRTLPSQPEFTAWTNQLPPAAQQMLANSWESKVMIDAFNDFKDWKAKRDTQAQAQAETNKQRDKRLAGAIPATTGAPTGANAVDDDEAFAAGFKSVRG
jgi:hypothetical protein